MANRSQQLIPAETVERRGFFTGSLLCLFYFISTLEAYQFNLQSVGVVVSLEHIFFLVLLIFLSLQIIMNWHRILRISLRPPLFMLPLIVWYVIGTMGLAWSDNAGGTVKLILVNGLRLGIMFIYFIWLSHEYQFRALAKAVVITAAIIGAYGVLQSYSQFFMSEPLAPPFIEYFDSKVRLSGYGTGGHLIRTSGFNNNPSYFALLIVIGLNMSAASAIYYYKQKMGGIGMMYLLCSIFSLIVLPHTVSGSALLSVVISILVMASFGLQINPLRVGLKMKKYLVKIGVALLIAATLVGVAVGPKLAIIGKIIFTQKLSSSAMDKEISGTFSENWELTKEVLANNMVFGSGWASNAQWEAKQVIGAKIGVHSNWMLFLVETGFVGFLLQIMVFILFVKTVYFSLKILPKNSFVYYLQVAVLASYLSLATVGISRQFYLVDQAYILFGLGSAIYIWAKNNAVAVE